MVAVTDRTELAQFLIALRKEREWNQRELAAAIGISESFVARIESGDRSISVENVEAAITNLGLDEADALALRRARDATSAAARWRTADEAMDDFSDLVPDILMRRIRALESDLRTLAERTAEQQRQQRMILHVLREVAELSGVDASELPDDEQGPTAIGQ